MSGNALTAIIPTRNRPHNLPGQLRLFEDVCYPVVVADSSDAELAAHIRSVVRGRFEYQAHAPELTLCGKLARALASVETPFVLLASDRKITFPHAVDALLAHLMRHESHVAAQGYVVGFSSHENAIDINRVIWFTPTIGEADAMQRHYHLMRRYQSWQFSLFRTAPLMKAAAFASKIEGAVFQEIAFMNAMVLQGPMARLPTILTLQSPEQSFHPSKRKHPFHWFLDDINAFFQHYVLYREALARFIVELGIRAQTGVDLNQSIDLIHAIWLHKEFDYGTMNSAAQLMLRVPLPPLPYLRSNLVWPKPTRKDTVRVGRGRYRYIWRREVLNAEPKNEIRISVEEIERVSSALDIYFGAFSPTAA